MAKTIIDELTGYRVKVKRDGKEIVNMPGILILPGLLMAPKAGIIGMIAAPLLGCSVHLESEDGKEVDIGKAVKDAADTVVDTATTVAKTLRKPGRHYLQMIRRGVLKERRMKRILLIRTIQRMTSPPFM